MAGDKVAHVGRYHLWQHCGVCRTESRDDEGEPRVTDNPEAPPVEDDPIELVAVDPKAEAFYSGAYSRISRTIIALGLIATPLLAWRFGWKFAAGFLAGCAAAYVNFAWLKLAVDGMVDKMAANRRAPSGAALIFRFFWRYIFIALLAYVIFRGSSHAVYGFCAGLFVPIAAAMCEGIYEAMTAIRGRF